MSVYMARTGAGKRICYSITQPSTDSASASTVAEPPVNTASRTPASDIVHTLGPGSGRTADDQVLAARTAETALEPFANFSPLYDTNAELLPSYAPADGWEHWSDTFEATQIPWDDSFGNAQDLNFAPSEHIRSEDPLPIVDHKTPEVLQNSQQVSPNEDAVSTSHLADTQGSDSAAKLTRTRSQIQAELPDDPFSEVARQLTSRLGRLQIAEDGRPRYYGATSNLHLLHGGSDALTQPNIRHVMIHGEAAIMKAGLQWDRDASFEAHLMSLFFSWHNSLQFPVDKAIFLREREKYQAGLDTELYSPSLENAILCIGAAYTDRSHDRIQGPVDEFLALRAKAFLDIEIDSPTIATVQALLILSSHEAAHTRETRGWIYMGMATQIVTDLGLHLDLESEYSRLGGIDGLDDINITRRNVFWTVKSTDTLWSAYSGRPSLTKNLVHDQKGPLPSRTYQWEPYLDQHSTINFPAGFDFRTAAHVHVYLASLMLILGRVSEVLYSGVPDISSNIQEFVREADADFQEWMKELPPMLRLDDKQAFHVQSVLELHLIYHESIILLHRPLITPLDNVAGASPADKDAAETSLNMCLESADAICKIIVLYRNRYGLKRLHHQMVHAAMTAALIHIFQLCSTPSGQREDQKAQASFLTCVQALGEMGQTFKSASRALDVVTSLRRSWRDDTTAGDRFKRARFR
ncbi:Nitrogen assimilation transcription factor nit-4 [Cyphellophora attinorum]|uniref:Nitrogen assimilation transcription factor nit-4 n=1 Tax=Cyphellophora attinorum TaxID=1664694 RepID=A0A0N1HNG3_9EURO|nr:Nitrogen assimilation transcription factor nit-4 [Phialophora attinorum]KPI36587.1 Nitrogen assimilation transcription factor nit-4 [Phialophora attinorum]